MELAGITWRGESIDDAEILQTLPPDLVRILSITNGFILHHGALHVRGASRTPDWHSLRSAWQGPCAIYRLYESVAVTDVPFAQDQLGDQLLLRDGRVIRLAAETGDLEPIAESLVDFFRHVGEDIEGFLNVGLHFTMQPGQLLLAAPPFVLAESGVAVSLKPICADEVIRFHADFARQIRDVPDGEKVVMKFENG